MDSVRLRSPPIDHDTPRKVTAIPGAVVASAPFAAYNIMQRVFKSNTSFSSMVIVSIGIAASEKNIDVKRETLNRCILDINSK